MSDRLLSLAGNSESMVWLSTAKGVFFVAATTILFYFALRAVPSASKDATTGVSSTSSFQSPEPRWHIYAIAVASIVALVIGLVTTSTSQSDKYDKERAIVETQNVVRLLDREISARFEKIDVALRSIAYMYRSKMGAKGSDATKLSDYVAHQKTLLPDISTLSVADSEGVVRFGSDILAGKAINVADRDYFIRARDDPHSRLIVSGPVFDKNKNEWVVILARRINAAEEHFTGIVFATLATTHLNAPLASVELGAQGAATVRALDLALIHRFPDTRNSVGSKSVSKELREHIEAMPKGGTYVAQTQLDGIERINSFKKMEQYPFYIIVGLSTQDQRIAAKQEVPILVGLGGLAIMATIVATLLAYRAYRKQAIDLEERRCIDDELNRLLVERTKLSEELILRADEAELANRTKSEFIANMSHEIRTPMNAILGLTYLLDKAALPGSASEMINKIRLAGRTLLGIINDILDFSKIESGKLEIAKMPFRLGDVLDDLATIMSTNAGEKEIELIIASPPSRTSSLIGDALRLEQVLINLTGNAIKFTERGHVAVSIEVLDEKEGEVTLRFSVSDSGIGIPANKQEEIFAPFSQVDNSTSRRFGGSGLGLTISRRLVESMGGELKLTSVPGSGSEFWFTLTFARAQDVLLASPEMAHLPVLVADDNPIAREALRSIVDNMGWHATTVSSGQEAIDYARAKLSDPVAQMEILLIDFKMPGMDGLVTAKTIRHDLKNAADPIIIMVTAFSSAQLLDHPDGHFADAILNKPVTQSTLFNAVARAMRVRQGGEEQVACKAIQRLAGLRILVVDDSEINREVAERILSAEGATVTHACDGQQALCWLKDNATEVDVVLMDIQMPIMNGYEATRRIRRIPALAELPIIALTAGAFLEQQELAREAGMNCFIAKPFDVDAAVALIIRVTGHDIEVLSDQTTSLANAPADNRDEFPGLDVEKGIYLVRKPEIYRKLLAKFTTEFTDVVSKMRSVEPSEIAFMAHTLKGAAASLAIKEVSTRASDLEQLCKQEENTFIAMETLESALATALTSIRRYLDSSSTVESGPLPAEK